MCDEVELKSVEQHGNFYHTLESSYKIIYVEHALYMSLSLW